MSVLVFTENWDGKFKKLSFELASYASGVAEMMKTNAIALSIGNVDKDELKKLGSYGISKIIDIRDDKLHHLDNQVYTQVIASVAENVGATLLVLSHNHTGKALAPRLSVKLKAGLVAGVMGLPLSTDPTIVRKKVFSGKAYSLVEIKTSLKILTLSQNSFVLIPRDTSLVIESFSPDYDFGLISTTVINVEKQTGKIILTDAEIVISGGRGMKGPENWAPLEELAEVLGAGLACSRPVSDEGWRSHEEHTGQTGKIIAPNLYMAFGISGAIQHLAGVSSSKYIVAVNTDKDAPIFEAADYGVVGDALKVLPELVKEIKAAKSS
ncbi:MAG: electron transfer flavoprotein subunit alpha [Bacteroides sp. SM23_62_1]|nr:MAG: electron transfer flavoprotein subunit alpha [Bacteroides sp. SM23_62_1]